jgi:hypothetical protein
VYGSICSETHLLSWFLLLWQWFLSQRLDRLENTSLSNQALTLALVNLLLLSLPGAVGVSEAQKRRCARLILTPPEYYWISMIALVLIIYLVWALGIWKEKISYCKKAYSYNHKFTLKTVVFYLIYYPSATSRKRRKDPSYWMGENLANNKVLRYSSTCIGLTLSTEEKLKYYT